MYGNPCSNGTFVAEGYDIKMLGPDIISLLIHWTDGETAVSM